MSLQLSQTVAVVLAGGFGTRVAHLLPGVPKPMAPVAGKPFLEWVVRCLAQQGIVKVLLSTGHMAEVAKRHFQPQPVVGVITSLQEQIEWHLRVASLCVGLAVGIMSLVAMARKLWRK